MKQNVWAIVEIMGYTKVAGKIREESVAGAVMLRVDVPAVGDQPAFTKLYSAQSLYSITPVSEDVAMAAALRYRVVPFVIYIQDGPRLEVFANKVTDFDAVFNSDGEEGEYPADSREREHLRSIEYGSDDDSQPPDESAMHASEWD